MVNDLLLLEGEAYRILSTLFWALDLTRKDAPNEPNSCLSFTHLLQPLQEELDAVQIYISSLSENMVETIERIRQIKPKPIVQDARKGIETVDDLLSGKSMSWRETQNLRVSQPLDVFTEGEAGVLGNLLRKHQVLTEQLQKRYWSSSDQELATHVTSTEAKVGKYYRKYTS